MRVALPLLVPRGEKVQVQLHLADGESGRWLKTLRGVAAMLGVIDILKISPFSNFSFFPGLSPVS